LFPKARCLVPFQVHKSYKKLAKQNPEKLLYLLKNARLHRVGISSPNIIFESTNYLKPKV